MAHVALTGANGFLGWHTRAALKEKGIAAVAVPVGRDFDVPGAAAAMDNASRVIHLAGVNRGTDVEVNEGNVRFAKQFASALRTTETPPPVVVYANSVQADNGTVYGTAKARAADVLASAAADVGADFVDIFLPNIFGEHGRPFYNSVTSTFSHLLAVGGNPTVDQDRDLTLLHAQNAADVLTGSVSVEQLTTLQHHESVSGLLSRLQKYAKMYEVGEIPDIAANFDRDLFNTYRSHTFPDFTPVQLNRHADERGAFFEIIRSHGGPGQSSFSTTAPGITRGDHFHRRKIERFTVLEGHARISLRRLYTDRVFTFDVSGDKPCAIDMPTMWSHNIKNTGTGALFTSFWTNDHFDPNSPDTIGEVV